MKRLLVVIVLTLGVLFAPALATAHPLGNFTINHYAGIELAGDSVYVRYALDLAEVPTFQDGGRVERRAFAEKVARELELRLDGRRAPLVLVDARTLRRPGAGGLETLRLDAILRATGRGSRLTFTDPLYASRIGWREITISARDGASLSGADVPAMSSSNELRSYPNGSLSSPLSIRAAHAQFTLGTRSAPAPVIGDAARADHRGGGLESLIERGELSPLVVLVALLIAAFWGAVHALTPGHGKAIVAGYLVGTRGRPRDAFLLGITVTVTHTIGVFALGFVTLALSRFIVPEQLYPWLTLVSGLLVVAVGLGVLRARLRTGTWNDHHHHGDHDHSHGEGHDHAHDHAHDGHGHRAHHHHRGEHRDRVLTSRGILGVGIAAGLLPCPSALVVLLSAIALHRVGFGLALIVAFSLGLAATITAIGLVAVLARRRFGRSSFDGPAVRLLPALSALAILIVGAGLTVRAIPGVLAVVGW